jgi:hypothetical protein
MKVPDLRMKCSIENCQDPYNKVERRAPQVWMCATHWQPYLERHLIVEKFIMAHVERKKRLEKGAHQVALQAARWSYPPRIRPYTNVHEVNAGLPSLGKGQ